MPSTEFPPPECIFWTNAAALLDTVASNTIAIGPRYNGVLTDEQQNQLKDILRLIPPDEQAAFLDMLAPDLRGRDLDRGELRRVAEHTWRKFLQHGWPMHSPGDVA